MQDAQTMDFLYITKQIQAVEEHGHAWATIARLLSDRKARQMAETGQKGPFCR